MITLVDAQTHSAVRALIVKGIYMELMRFLEIAQELPDLLDQQMNILTSRGLHSLSNSERVAYDERKARILQLRAELERLRKAK